MKNKENFVNEQVKLAMEYIKENNLQEQKHRSCDNGPLHPDQDYWDFIVKSSKKVVKDKDLRDALTR